MATIETENLTIQYRQAGHGPIKLVLIHGNYASSRWWLPLLERLPSNVQAFAPDLRGCGSNDGVTHPLEPSNGQLSIGNLSNDVAEFIAALHLNKPIIVGHSLGGIIATDFALKYQDRISGLLLEDTGPPNGLSSGFMAQSMLIPLEFGSKILMRNALRLAGLPRRGSLAKALVEDALAAAPGQYRSFSKAVARWDIESDLPNLKVPLLLIWGGKDRVMLPRIGHHYLRAIPHAEMLIVPDAGHSPHLERPNAFSGALGQFVEKCVSESETVISGISPRSLKDQISRWIRITITGS